MLTYCNNGCYGNIFPHHCHHHHHCPPRGRVKITGQIVLLVDMIDHHGHIRKVAIEENKKYYIEAVSQTKGRCTFVGKVIDFDAVTGVENILQKPHNVKVGALIVDYSTEYESKVIRINVGNIIAIRPVEPVYDEDEAYDPEDFIIDDPFASDNDSANQGSSSAGGNGNTTHVYDEFGNEEL